MCTAVSYHTKDHYFGRNLDFECSYGESVTITPRRFLFCLPAGGEGQHSLVGAAALDFGAMRNRSRGKGAFGADCSDR